MSQKPCLYLSGPMTGMPAWNFPAFNRAADVLRAAGYPVINPADFGADPRHAWADCLRRDLAAMTHCDTVVLLNGWARSKGARLEVHVARELDMTVVKLDDLLWDAVVEEAITPCE